MKPPKNISKVFVLLPDIYILILFLFVFCISFLCTNKFEMFGRENEKFWGKNYEKNRSRKK